MLGSGLNASKATTRGFQDIADFTKFHSSHYQLTLTTQDGFVVYVQFW